MPRTYKRKNKYIWRARPELTEQKTEFVIQAYFDRRTAKDTAYDVGLSRQTVAKVFHAISASLEEWRNELLDDWFSKHEIKTSVSKERMEELKIFPRRLVRAIGMNHLFREAAKVSYRVVFLESGRIERQSVNVDVAKIVERELELGKLRGREPVRCIRRAVISSYAAYVTAFLADGLIRVALKNYDFFAHSIKVYGKMTEDQYLASIDALAIQDNLGVKSDAFLKRLEEKPLRL